MRLSKSAKPIRSESMRRLSLLTTQTLSNVFASFSSAAENTQRGCIKVAKQTDSVGQSFDSRPGRRKTRLVQFESVEIRSYPIVLGDNPSVSGGGPPVSIGWEHDSVTKQSVDNHENEKADSGKPGEAEKIPAHTRRSILMKNGFKPVEIAKAYNETKLIRNKRKSAVRSL